MEKRKDKNMMLVVLRLMLVVLRLRRLVYNPLLEFIKHIWEILMHSD
jgi:hypothetical protein